MCVCFFYEALCVFVAEQYHISLDSNVDREGRRVCILFPGIQSFVLDLESCGVVL